MQSETQDGKTILNGHFARYMWHVKIYIYIYMYVYNMYEQNKITRIETTRRLGFILSCNGEMKNVMIWVVETTNSELNNIIEHALSRHISSMPIKHISHLILIMMLYLQMTKRFLIHFYPHQSKLKFNVGVQSFGNINRIVNFCVNNTKWSETNSDNTNY